MSASCETLYPRRESIENLGEMATAGRQINDCRNEAWGKTDTTSLCQGAYKNTTASKSY